MHDDRRLFEFLVLDCFQAGLTWLLILQRRDYLRNAFEDFDAEKIASFTSADKERIMNAPRMIRNKAKIEATINNAAHFLQIQKEFGSFDAYIWNFVNGKTIKHSFKTLSDLPAETAESEAMSKDLKKHGFKFVGPTICYAFMQAAGLVNDHLTFCFRYKQIKDCNL